MTVFKDLQNLEDYRWFRNPTIRLAIQYASWTTPVRFPGVSANGGSAARHPEQGWCLRPMTGTQSHPDRGTGVQAPTPHPLRAGPEGPGPVPARSSAGPVQVNFLMNDKEDFFNYTDKF